MAAMQRNCTFSVSAVVLRGERALLRRMSRVPCSWLSTSWAQTTRVVCRLSHIRFSRWSFPASGSPKGPAKGLGKSCRNSSNTIPPFSSAAAKNRKASSFSISWTMLMGPERELYTVSPSRSRMRT